MIMTEIIGCNRVHVRTEDNETNYQNMLRAQGEVIESRHATTVAENALADVQEELRATTRSLNQALSQQQTGTNAKMTSVPLPGSYDGDKKKYREFKTKLQAKFRGDARTFADEQHKLTVACNLLTGGAGDKHTPVPPG